MLLWFLGRRLTFAVLPEVQNVNWEDSGKVVQPLQHKSRKTVE